MLLLAALTVTLQLGCPATINADRQSDGAVEWLVFATCDPRITPCPPAGYVGTELLTEADAAAAADAIGDHGCWIHPDQPMCCYATRPANSQTKIPPANVRGIVLAIFDAQAKRHPAGKE